MSKENLDIEIIKLYQTKISIRDICTILKVSHGKIYNVLNKNNIKKDKKSRKIRGTKIPYNEIIELYKIGINTKEISNMFNICESTIYSAIKKIDKSFKLKYKKNENYFDSIDTEDKAYFLGLLYADGCNNGGGFYVTLQDRDIDILIKFKEFLKFSGELKFIKGKINCKDYYSLNVSSKKISNTLMKHGCNINKTINAIFPNITNELMNHFIRGVFDGDGSISIDKKNQLTFSIVGNSTIISEIGKIINRECDINVNIRKPNRYKCDISIYQFGGNKQAKRVEEYLYKNATIFLNRKKLKFKENDNKRNML